MKNYFTNVGSTIILTIICVTFLFISGSVFASGTLYRSQDFDNPVFPPAGWSVANTVNYNWTRTTYCSSYGIGVAAACIDFYDLASGSFDLISPVFTPSTSGDSLLFDHAHAPAASENDNLSIYTSSNGGSTWTLLINLSGGPSGPLNTASPTLDLFKPTISQWATKRYALPVGTNEIKFTAFTAFGNNLYLDNIRIGSPYSIDVGANTILTPKWGIVAGTYSPTGSVKNYGTTTQSFSVTLTINPGSYTNTQNITNLAPGQTQNVTFSSFNFSTNGNYTMKAFSTLSTDQNTVNDTATSVVMVTPSPRNPMLEFSTGTWCQWCACGDKVADTLAERYPNSVIFAYHGAGSDPWQTFNGNGIMSMLGISSAYPSGVIDRRGPLTGLGWGSFFTDAECSMYSNPSATINLVITNLTYNSTTRQLTVNLNATALQTLSGQYKVNYTITEDNLVYSQQGNSTCSGSSSWVHNWVVRNIVNGASGDNVNSGTWNINQMYPLTVTTTLDASWISNNCKINVFIYNGTSGTGNASSIQSATKAWINPVGIQNGNSELPKSYELQQNFPNPFNPTTNIHFSIPKDGQVSLKIYDAIGREVAVYYDGFIKAGVYNAEIDASKWASGLYFYTLMSKDFVQTKKMILVK